MRFIFLWLVLSFYSLQLYGDPWGKDSDLSDKRWHYSPPEVSEEAHPISTALIRFHQEVISPADGPRSHFIPSSSQYTLDAIHKYGFIEGVLLGCDRLMRENDEEWVYGEILDPAGHLMKYDPVDSF